MYLIMASTINNDQPVATSHLYDNRKFRHVINSIN